jgi:hypothetical protein
MMLLHSAGAFQNSQSPEDAVAGPVMVSILPVRIWQGWSILTSFQNKTAKTTVRQSLIKSPSNSARPR